MHTAALDSDVVTAFIEAAADPNRWPDAWAALCITFEADCGVIYRQTRVPDGVSRVVVDWPPLPLRVFDDGCIHLDPFAPPGKLADHFGALLGRQTQVQREFADPAQYPAFARRAIAQAHHVLCAPMEIEGFAIAGVALHRGEEAEPFTARDERLLPLLARHLAAALRLERVLAESRIAQAARDSALDQLSHGAVLADGAGRVLFANRTAWSMAARGGIDISSAAGIRPTDPAQAAAFSKLLRQAARGRAGGSLRLLRERGAPIAASVEPLAGDMTLHGGTALVSLRDLAPSLDVSAPQLMALFELTPAEVSIVPQLLAGESAQLIAKSRGVKVTTVRDQAARILAKTGAPNLRALATMIAALD